MRLKRRKSKKKASAPIDLTKLLGGMPKTKIGIAVLVLIEVTRQVVVAFF